jgi:hypothetical protein
MNVESGEQVQSANNTNMGIHWKAPAIMDRMNTAEHAALVAPDMGSSLQVSASQSIKGGSTGSGPGHDLAQPWVMVRPSRRFKHKGNEQVDTVVKQDSARIRQDLSFHSTAHSKRKKIYNPPNPRMAETSQTTTEKLTAPTDHNPVRENGRGTSSSTITTT